MDINEVWPQTWVAIQIRPLVWTEYSEPHSAVDINGAPVPVAIHVEVRVDAMRMGEVTVPILKGQGHGETLGQALVEVGLQMAYPDFLSRMEAILEKVQQKAQHDA